MPQTLRQFEDAVTRLRGMLARIIPPYIRALNMRGAPDVDARDREKREREYKARRTIWRDREKTRPPRAIVRAGEHARVSLVKRA